LSTGARKLASKGQFGTVSSGYTVLNCPLDTTSYSPNEESASDPRLDQ